MCFAGAVFIHWELLAPPHTVRAASASRFFGSNDLLVHQRYAAVRASAVCVSLCAVPCVLFTSKAWQAEILYSSCRLYSVQPTRQNWISFLMPPAQRNSRQGHMVRFSNADLMWRETLTKSDNKKVLLECLPAVVKKLIKATNTRKVNEMEWTVCSNSNPLTWNFSSRFANARSNLWYYCDIRLSLRIRVQQ